MEQMLNISKITNMLGTFLGCKNLNTLTLGNNFVNTSVTERLYF